MVASKRWCAMLFLIVNIFVGRTICSHYMFTIGGAYYSRQNTCKKTCEGMESTCVAFKIDNDNPFGENVVTTTLLQELLFRILKWPCAHTGSPNHSSAKATTVYSPYISHYLLKEYNCYGWNSNTIQTSCTTGTVQYGERLCLCRKENSFVEKNGCPSGFQRLDNQCIFPHPVKTAFLTVVQTYHCPPNSKLLSFDDPTGYKLVVKAGKTYFPKMQMWVGGRIAGGYLVNYMSAQRTTNLSYYGNHNGVPTQNYALLNTDTEWLTYTNGGGSYVAVCVRDPFVIISKGVATVTFKKGQRLLKTPVATLRGYTLDLCFAACMGDMKIGCLSLNMHATNGVCELLAESAENWKSVLINDTNWYHYSVNMEVFPLN